MSKDSKRSADHLICRLRDTVTALEKEVAQLRKAHAESEQTLAKAERLLLECVRAVV